MSKVTGSLQRCALSKRSRKSYSEDVYRELRRLPLQEEPGLKLETGKGSVDLVVISNVMTTDVHSHWQSIYKTKAPDKVSWYQPHLQRSLALIEDALPRRTAEIIDVGGGESTLVDDLVIRGYNHLTVLDVSETALATSRRRLGRSGEGVRWICADVTSAPLPSNFYDLWHDRAVFHFLTSDSQRSAYVEAVENAMKPGGHVIVSTFGPEGPTTCSGLPVVRYDAQTLHAQFGDRFTMIESFKELHRTPFGTVQQFLYCHFRLV
jgi:SAM-dependent methyltransferase